MKSDADSATNSEANLEEAPQSERLPNDQVKTTPIDHAHLRPHQILNYKEVAGVETVMERNRRRLAWRSASAFSLCLNSNRPPQSALGCRKSHRSFTRYRLNQQQLCRYDPRRHSQDDFVARSANRYRSQDYICQAGGGKQSTSHSSSSASDSAFSHSQTTLQSEGEQSSANSFTRSMNEHDDSSYSTNQSIAKQHSSNRPTISADNPADDLDPSKLTRQTKDSADCIENPTNNHFDLMDSNKDEFSIIWRNLSYRLVDKRITRIANCLRRHKEKLWHSKNESTIKQVEIASPLPDQLKSTEPPIRAPVAGKPRRVIFSGLHGSIKSGELTAILGPSGAGKTTFLKCLTNSIVEGVSGSIDIKGGANSSHLKLCIIPQKGEYLEGFNY